MKVSGIVVALSWLVALLAAIAAAAGLFWKDGGAPFSFSTLRGQTVQMFGRGLYRFVGALIKSGPPDRMDSYTTMVTYALDLAVITPATFLCAVLVWRGDPQGYVIAVPLLTLIVLLAPQIILGTIFQRSAGVPFTTGEMIGPVAGFVILGLIAAWLLAAILRPLARIA